MQDVAYVVERTKTLTDPSLPLPMEMLEELVKAKPTPRRTAQMSTALNGLLRRKNEVANSSTTSVNETSGSVQVNPENVDADLENDEDALVTIDVPAETREPIQVEQTAGALPESEDSAASAVIEGALEEPAKLSEQTVAPVPGNENVASQQESADQTSAQDEGGIGKNASDEVVGTEDAEGAPEETATSPLKDPLP